MTERRRADSVLLDMLDEKLEMEMGIEQSFRGKTSDREVLQHNRASFNIEYLTKIKNLFLDALKGMSLEYSLESRKESRMLYGMSLRMIYIGSPPYQLGRISPLLSALSENYSMLDMCLREIGKHKKKYEKTYLKYKDTIGGDDVSLVNYKIIMLFIDIIEGIKDEWIEATKTVYPKAFT